MPASDTWPCRDAMEPLVSMNSASSCDSMVSTNSGFSDDSMEYLSAEERACLMFLEETIESLEAEDDSGVSNDEPDFLSCCPATKVDHLRPGGQNKAEGEPPKGLGKDHKPNGFPTSLVLTNGNKSGESARLLSNPTTTEPHADKSDDLADLPPPFIPEPPVKADSSNDSKNKGFPPKIQLDPMLDQMSKTRMDPRLDQKSISVPSDVLMELIPPPSDFMDEPEPAPPVPAQTSKQSQLQPQTQAPAQVQAKPQMQPQTQIPGQVQAKPQVQPQTQAPGQVQTKPQMQPQTQIPAQVQAKPQMQPQKEAPAEAKVNLQTQTFAQAQVKPKTQAPAQDQSKPQTQAPSQDLAKPHTQAPEQDQGKTQTQIPSQDQAKPQTKTSQDLTKPQTQAPAQDQTKPQMQNLFQPQPQLPHQLQAQPSTESITIAPPLGFGGQAEDDHPQNTVTPSSRGPLSPTQLDVLRKKASLKKAPEKAPVVPIVRPSGQKVSNQASLTSSYSEGHPPTAVGHIEPKGPPAVAPKPKKLSPKIVLKSHKDSVPGHSLVSSGERMMNPQKVHIEALKKLGLLKVDETDSAPSLSSSPPHKIPPPPAFNTTTVPPSGDATHEMKPAEVEVQGKINLILPAQSNPENGGRESPVIPRGQSRKSFEIKSASLERPKMGLKSVTADHSSLLMNQEKNQEKTNVELSPGQLRRSRSRPASAGNRNEMGIDQLPSNSGKEQDVRRSLGSSPIPPLLQPSTDSQVPPRSHGMISVLFTPHSKNEEERKQALKRLGLI